MDKKLIGIVAGASVLIIAGMFAFNSNKNGATSDTPTTKPTVSETSTKTGSGNPELTKQENDIMNWNPDEVKKDKIKFQGTEELKLETASDAIASYIKSKNVKFEKFDVNGTPSYMVDRNFTTSGSYIGEVKQVLESYANKKPIASIFITAKENTFEFMLDNDYKVTGIKNVSAGTVIENKSIVGKNILEVLE